MQKLRLWEGMRHAVWLPEVLGHRRRAGVSSVSSSILWVTSSDLPGISPRLPNDCFPPAEGRRGLRYHGNGYPHIPRGWLAVSQAPSRGRRGASRLPRVLNPCHRDSVWCPPNSMPSFMGSPPHPGFSRPRDSEYVWGGWRCAPTHCDGTGRGVRVGVVTWAHG